MSDSDSSSLIRGSFLVEVRADDQTAATNAGGADLEKHDDTNDFKSNDKHNDKHNGVVVWLVGEHDAAAATDLSDLLHAATEMSPGEVVVDLSRVTFLSAATIGILVRCSNAIREQERDFTLRSPSDRAKRLLALCAIPYVDGHGPAGEGGRRDSALASWVPVPSRPPAKPSHRSLEESSGVDAVGTEHRSAAEESVS